MRRFGYAEIIPDEAHRERLLNRISAIYNRCHNPNDAGYHHYGGRGIWVYEPWLGNRAAFLAYLVTLDGWDQPHLQLDRIDNNRGYEPDNLRFVTPKQNVGNRRSVKSLQRRIQELEEEVRCLRLEKLRAE